MAEMGEMAPIEHYREEIDQLNMLTAMLVTRRMETKDNRDYNDEESDNPDYYGAHSEGQVLLTGNGDDSPPNGFGTETIDGRHTDSDVEAYLPNRIAPSEYQGAKRTICRDSFKTLAKRIWRNAKTVKWGDLSESLKRL